MSRKTKQISILQFDERLISRLRVRRSSRGVDVISFDQERGHWAEHDGSLAEALKAFIEKHEVAEDVVYTVLPRHTMTARILDLPSQDPEELSGMVRLSAEEYVPFPAEELIVDQCLLHKLGDGQSRVLAVFAHRDIVESHIELLREAKVEPRQVFVSTACLASAALAGRADAPDRFAVVDLGSGGIEVVAVHGSRLEYGRAVASVQDWTLQGDDAAEPQDELAIELRASLSAQMRESEDGEGVEKVYVCSGWADVAHHGEALFHEVGRECEPAPMVRSVVSRGAGEVPHTPLVLLGAALAAQDRAPITIRLLPEAVLLRRERSALKRKAIKFAVLAAAIVLALLGIYLQALYQRKAYIGALEKQVAEYEPRATEILSKQKQLSILQQQVSRSGSVVELLAALCEIFPDSGMNITKFLFQHESRIEVWGRAESLGDLENFVEDLFEVGKSAIPQFAMAERIYEQKVRERNEEVYNFHISMPFPESEESDREEEDFE